MLVYAKLLYNGAEGAVLENFTLKFENCNDFASFFWFWANCLFFEKFANKYAIKRLKYGILVCFRGIWKF